MREFNDKELYLGLAYAKSLDEQSGRVILEKFQQTQPLLAQTLLGVFPSVIAEQDQTMAHLYLDLVFDILCTFQHIAGELPSQQSMGLNWLQEKAAFLDSEMMSMMSGKFDRHSVFDSNDQTGLTRFMHDSVDAYTSENPIPVPAIRLVKTLLFVTVQLFCSLHDQAASAKTVH